jgi:phage-related protein
MPVHARPLKTVGRGVWELKISEKAGQFRVIYVTQRRDRIYVLHAFQKKTQRTPQKDIDLARARFKEI